SLTAGERDRHRAMISATGAARRAGERRARGFLPPRPAVKLSRRGAAAARRGPGEEAAMIEVRRLGPQIGVEIRGVDVKQLDAAGFATIYQAWLDHNVAVVPEQDLQLDDFLRYSRRFGVVVPHPSKSTRHPEVPEITMLGINKFGADGTLDMAIYRRGAE